MSEMKCITCDRCGKVIKGNVFKFEFWRREIHGYGTDLDIWRDLCWDCAKELEEWIKQGNGKKND